jgi:hypothetical protein
MIAKLVITAAIASAFVQPSAPRATSTKRFFFDQFIPNPEADAELDGYVGSAKAVLLTDGGAGSETVTTALAGQKLSQYTEVNLGSKPNKGALLGSLKRRVKVDAPVLIVAGQVFDKKRIEYLCKQDMMLPVFRAAGTSGEVRLPFQDLRFYLSKVDNR